jgi:hypothetical protein
VRPLNPPLRIALMGSNGYVIMSSPLGQKLFTWHLTDHSERSRFGEAMEHQTEYGIALDGKLDGDGQGKFVYAAYRAGVLGMADLNRTPPMFFIATLDHRGLPRVVTKQSYDTRVVRVDPQTPVAAGDICQVGEDVNVLMRAAPGSEQSTIDVYDHRTGRYRYSYHVTGRFVAAKWWRNKFYGITGTTVSVWSIQVTDSLE